VIRLLFLGRGRGENLFTAVDEEVYNQLFDRCTFSLSKFGYIIGHYKGTKNSFILARFVEDFPIGLLVHHIDENPFDNTKFNLMSITHKRHGEIHKVLESYTRISRPSYVELAMGLLTKFADQLNYSDLQKALQVIKRRQDYHESYNEQYVSLKF
jgi:hypothetical protein